MVNSAYLFISISISCETHSFKQYFQNHEPENPRTKIKKCCQNEQLKLINYIHNQLNIYMGENSSIHKEKADHLRICSNLLTIN